MTSFWCDVIWYILTTIRKICVHPVGKSVN